MGVLNLVDRFRLPNPAPDQAASIEHLRTATLHLAYEFQDVLPTCRETEQALTRLEEAFLWAVAAVTRHTGPLTNRSTRSSR